MDKRYEIINSKLNSLSKSTFRSSFYLKDMDKNYIIDKGMDVIKDHAYDIILKKQKSHSRELIRELDFSFLFLKTFTWMIIYGMIIMVIIWLFLKEEDMYMV